MPRNTMVVLLVFLTVACWEGRHDQSMPTSEITLGSELFVAGRDEHRLGHVLHNIRGGIFKDSIVVLADGASGELRTYTMHGDQIAVMGRLGSGPGEFRLLWRMWNTTGDTMATVDMVRGVIGLWSLRSGFIEEFPIASDFAAESADSTIIVGIHPPADIIGSSGTVRVDSAIIVVLERSAPAVMHELMSVPWRSFLSIQAPHGRTLGMVHPLEPRGIVVTNDGVVYYAFTNSAVVHRMVPGGAPQASLSLDIPRRQFAPNLRKLWIDSEVARVPPPRKAEMRRYVESVPLPDSLPLIDALFVDEVGRIWTRDFAIDGETHTTWRVADRSGALIGLVELPYAARPLQITENDLLLHIAAGDSPEEVVLYELFAGTTTLAN